VPAEAYRVPEATAAAVERCRAAGGRVVAVGTTVVRALETAAGLSTGESQGGSPDPSEAGGTVRAGAGVSRLRIRPGHRLLAVDGLLTGLHEPEASHLDLLGAFVDPEVLARAYRVALDAGYLWHEFGDVCLVIG
jgi:S-adenosylmethionine:tRNA ribosyltransferase-isomerase